MIKRLFTTLVVLIGLGGLWTEALYAQVDSLQATPRDSVAEASQPPEGEGVSQPGRLIGRPSSVQNVRQRIARIPFGTSSVQRVIYPIIILHSPPTVYIQERPGASELGQQQAPGARAPRRLESGYPRSYYDGYDALPDEAPPPTVRFRNQREAPADSMAPSLAADSAAVSSVGPASETPSAPIPTVRRVEREMLETGLFRAVGVNFEFDQSTILSTFRPTLNAVGEVLRKYPDLRIQIAGHTDAVGTEDYNQRLSLRRAQAVQQYLIQQFRVAPARLEVQGYGEAQPIASNDTRTGRALNRRVEFRVLNPEAAERIEEAPADSLERKRIEDAIRNAIREEIQGTPPDTTGQ